MSRRSTRISISQEKRNISESDQEAEWNASKSLPAIEERRKSLRKKTPVKYDDYVFESYSKSNRQSKQKETVSSTSEEDDDDGEAYEPHERPTTLFTENDVAGSHLFAFRTPKKRNGMALLAANTPKTPKLSSAIEAMSIQSPQTHTPRDKGRECLADTTKTPHRQRDKVRKDLKKVQEEEEESGTDFSTDEDPDYNESGTSESSDGDSGASKSDEESEEEGAKAIRTGRPIIKPQPTAQHLASRSTRQTRRLHQTEDCLPQSDVYFSAHSNKKIKTSNRTLGHLKNSRLQHDDLFSLLKSIQLSKEHMTKIHELNQDHEQSFGKWMTVFSKGFNVIIYGLGSKQRVTHQFCLQKIANRPTIIVNGFFPTLTVKDILHSIMTEILKVKTATRNNHEAVDVISTAFKSSPETHLFLIINNIDGPMLRKTKDQHILSRLAKIQNIHLLASIDHINAPMMWDQTCMSNFNFLWWDCTTMLPYTNETAFENSAYMRNSGELGLAAMCNVFQSLTTNAKGVYMLLVKDQLKNNKDANYQGMSFKDLYYGCREGFLVTSDLALRTQLTEFIDHNMVKNKRSVDGTEYLIISIEKHILEQFVDQQKG